jgi:hypothetical protein
MKVLSYFSYFIAKEQRLHNKQFSRKDAKAQRKKRKNRPHKNIKKFDIRYSHQIQQLCQSYDVGLLCALGGFARDRSSKLHFSYST